MSSKIHVIHARTHLPKRNRFWENVNKMDGCWLWTGAKNSEGYGQFGKITAHRRVIQLVKRELPLRYHVHHECGNKLCVRPACSTLAAVQPNASMVTI